MSDKREIRGKPCGHLRHWPGCRVCMLAQTNKEYQKLWGIVPDAEPKGQCIHLGAAKGLVECPSCAGTVRIRTFVCNLHGSCTISKRVGNLVTCHGCKDHCEDREGYEKDMKKIRWAVGVTTVPERKNSTLPITLASLQRAGFEDIRLFVDGVEDPVSSGYVYSGLRVTVRNPRVKAFGSWALAAWELMIRHPEAHRYAVFQDDLVACTGLREYLDALTMPPKGYWNMYCWDRMSGRRGPSNHEIATENGHEGFFPSNQQGMGALGLVFSRDGLQALLSAPGFVAKPISAIRPDETIDGCIMEAMRRAGWQEHVHYPSLLQHTGERSVIGHPKFPVSPSWRGEEWDARTLLTPQLLPTPSIPSPSSL